MDSIERGPSTTSEGEIQMAPSNFGIYNNPPFVNGMYVYQNGQPVHRHLGPNLVSHQPGPARIPLAQRRLLHRQHAQMARQREAQQRWLAEQQHQQRAYQNHQANVVNASENMAAMAAAAAYQTAAAAAVAAAAAAATASAYFYPTFYAAIPPQQLILEPTATATVIAQTTVAGPPFQLVQPQEVAVERVFAPAAAAAAQATLSTVMSRNGGGRTVVFRPQPSNQTAPAFAPYIVVENSPYYNYHQQHQQHFQPNQPWPPGAMTLRQLAEFMDLPQGATQQIIEKCSYLRIYRPPDKPVPVGEEDKCSVCLAEFEANENVRALPCSHFFHVECIDRWLMCNKKCPVCRLHIDRDLHQQVNGGIP